MRGNINFSMVYTESLRHQSFWHNYQSCGIIQKNPECLIMSVEMYLNMNRLYKSNQ